MRLFVSSKHPEYQAPATKVTKRVIVDSHATTRGGKAVVYVKTIKVKR